MIHIKRLNEMFFSKTVNESTIYDMIQKYRSDNLYFLDLIVGDNVDDDEKDYGLTLGGLIALYQHFYSNDISFFLEFIESVDEKSDFLDGYDGYLDFFKYAKFYLAYKLLDDISEEEIICAVENGDYYNYLGSDNMFEDFDERKQSEWADGIRAKLKELRGE